MTHPTHFAANGACIAGAPEPYPDLTEAEWAAVEAMAEEVMAQARAECGEFRIVEGPAW